MKKLNQIREDYDLITEKEENEERKLVALVRAGLFDAKKIPALKKALDKSADKMTAQERRMLINLLDELMSQVISNQPVYQKVKQNLMKEEKKEYPVDQTIPSVVLLKRKAIRTFPNGQKVALYYAQSIDKYVSIPYSDIGLSEEVELDEWVGPAIKGAIVAGGAAARLGGRALGAAKSYIGKKLAQRTAKQAADKAAKATEKAATAKKVEPIKKTLSNKSARSRATETRSATIAKRIKQASDKKKPGMLRRLGKGLRRLGGAAASIAGSGDSGSSSADNKPLLPPDLQSKAQATVTGPTKVGGADARAERERQASARATKAMATTSESVSVSLDGNLFEINNRAAQKVTSLYESLNKTNKKKMVEMMKESNESLEKVISFAIRQ